MIAPRKGDLMNRYITAGLVVVFVLMVNSVFAQDDTFDSSSPVDGHLTADTESGGESSGDGDGLKFGGPLLLSKMTMEVGGAITLEPAVFMPKRGDNVGGGWFRFDPELGFFVIDYLEILFNFSLGLPFGDLHKWQDADVGFAAGARYFFDFEAFAVYAGGMLGFSFVIPDDTHVNVQKYFDINLMGGVLLAMNKHVGIDLGIRFNTAILMGDYPNSNPGSSISFPMGYFGIDGFFNLFTGE